MFVMLLSLSALVSTALAVDSDLDGCDDAYEGNNACVSVDANVAPGTVVGANSEVRPFASVGPDVTLGADVTLAERSILGGRDTAAGNSSVGDGTIIGRRTSIGNDYTIAGDVAFSRAVTAGNGLQTGSGAAIGYGASIGDNVSIGANAIIGNLVGIGDNATVGTSAVLARSVTVGDAATPSLGSQIDGIVGPDSHLGVDVFVQSGARIRKQVTVGDGAQILATARIGRDTQIGADATIAGTVRTGAVVEAGATVEDGAMVARGALVCANATVPDSASVPSGGTWPLDGCTPPRSCAEILANGDSVGSGIYTIDPDEDGPIEAFDAYCDMATDGGGWTLAVRIRPDQQHYNAGAVGLPDDPDSLTSAKLSDTVINALRAPVYVDSVVRFQCASHTTYFRDSAVFTAVASGSSALDRCAKTWDATTWYQASGYPSHYGLNTWQQTAGCNYMIYYLAEQTYNGCYNGVDASGQSGTVWVK